jgi:threonine aldolase
MSLSGSATVICISSTHNIGPELRIQFLAASGQQDGVHLSANFSSDNVTPACDAIMAALNAANQNLVPSYGADEWTERLRARACEVFERDLVIYPVTTGTAANSLALSQIAPPYGTVYCYEAAHIVTDECGAPEFFTGGAKLSGLPASDGKIKPAQLTHAFEFADEMGVHHVKPAAVSLTQATEWGTVYSLTELASLGEIARSRNLPLHMDGARFANALVHLNCSAADATWRNGVDVLSLGATKNGALCAEAVVFFNPALAADFERRRKRAGHLWSKFRFLSAQLLAYLQDDLWLRNARHANAMAQRLAQGLRPLAGVKILHPVEANEIFVQMPVGMVKSLESQFKFYRWPLHASDEGIAVRLVSSYVTPATDVDEFIAAAMRLSR